VIRYPDRRSRRWRALGWLAVALLIALFASLPPRESPGARPTSPAARLLGPVAGVAARFQLLRAHHAVRAGRHELALARVEHALELDPTSTDAWKTLAWHLAIYLGSPARERDPERRARWVRAGVEVTERGEEHAARPAELAYQRGVILLTQAQLEDELRWPGGVAALRDGARRAFERAAALRVE